MTKVSARLPKLRIIAVDRLRGPDHMAMRTVVTGAPLRDVALDQLLVESCRRSTIGPLPSVSRRPSIVCAGTTPAKVPVTNASSAP